jgi:hypothetical protein
VEHVACMGENKNSYRILVQKSAGKRLLENCLCRREENVSRS